MDSNVFPAGFAPQDQQEQFPDYETESAALAVPPHEPDQHDSNLAVFLTEDQLSSIAHELVEGYEVDLASRKGWEESFINAIDLLGFNPVDKTEPWPGACSAVHPLLAEQAINFQSKAIQELYPAGGPVRTQIVGKTDGEKEKRAQRVKDFMNYQITKTMPEYYPDTDRMLLYLPLNGSAFKKVYYDETLGRSSIRFVPALDLVVDNACTDLATASRYTHVIRTTPNEIRKRQMAGAFRDVEIGVVSSTDPVLNGEVQKRIRQLHGITMTTSEQVDQSVLLEVHCLLDLPGFPHLNAEGEPSGLELPYIVTIDYDTRQVYSIRRNWRADDPMFKKIEAFIHYPYVPGLGFYGLGLFHLIGGLARSATSALQQLVDAGTLANLPAGFKAKGLQITGGSDPLRPGEFREVNTGGMDLDRAIKALPFKEPSQTLYLLLQYMVEAGRKFADATDQIVADSTNYGPVGTTLALLEEAGKPFSAIHKRMFEAERRQFERLVELNHEHMPQYYPYEVDGVSRAVYKEDFNPKDVGVLPVSDPSFPTSTHRMAIAQTIITTAQQAPQLHDMREAYSRFYSAMGVNDVDKLLPPPEQVAPADPVSENMTLFKGGKAQAGPDQNHEAHIQSHYAFLDDPRYGALEDPSLDGARAALKAHIAEHMAFRYRQEIEQIIGGPLPIGQPVPKQVEDQIALAVASASAALASSSRSMVEKPLSKEDIKVLELEQRRREADQKFSLGKESNIIEAGKVSLEAAAKGVELDLTAEQIAKENINAT